MDEVKQFRDIDRIAIIGGGNAGVTAAKYLVAEKAFGRVDIFEQRNRTGGLWNYNPLHDAESDYSIPQTIATAPLETPIWQIVAPKHADGTNGVDELHSREPTFNSPLYERLESNLPKMIMRYSDFEFSDATELFPTHQHVLEYLERYSEDVRHLMHFETQVQDIRRTCVNGRMVWSVTALNLSSGDQSIRTYDAVIIASGHFTVPYVPDIKGIREWNEFYPNAMSHSKHFRRPEDYTGKKVISIGRGYSGLDIASQLADHVAKPLIVSTYNPGPSDNDKDFVERPEIAEFLAPSSETARAVRFADGHIETDIDHILFCTGYMYSFPYLPTLTSAPSNPSAVEAPLITDGARPRNLYQYIFYNANPTLAVLCMPQQIVPFPIAEAQSAIVARAWAGRLDLPSRRAMLRWEEETAAARGDGKKWLWLKAPLDGRYLNGLVDWAATARPPQKRGDGSEPHEGSDGGGSGRESWGKQPTRWTEKHFWMRERVGDIKKAFVERGEARKHVCTLEELGFDFEEWKRAQQNGAAVGDS